MDLERALLSKILRGKDLTPLWEARITHEYFEDDEHRLIYRWMNRYFERYGEPPGEDALTAEYPSYRLARAEEPVDYYVDKLRERREYGLLVSVMEEAGEALEDRDNAQALKSLNLGVQNLYQETSAFTDEDVTKTGPERMAYYESLENAPGGLLGLPTGFGTVDMHTGGLQPEQLVTLIGQPKAGKSTILLYMAMASHAHGKRPLFLSFEMTVQEQTQRLDSLLAGVDYNHILQGKLTASEKKRLNKAHNSFDAMPPFIFVHDRVSNTSLGSLQAKIAQHQADIVFVDGAYLMDADLPNAEPMSPQALTWLTRNMKRMAQRLGKPVVITTQVLEWKYRKKKGLTQDTIGYSSSFAQDSDLILGVEEVDKHPELRNIRIVSARKATRAAIVAEIDWTQGRIQETEHQGDGEEDDAAT